MPRQHHPHHPFPPLLLLTFHHNDPPARRCTHQARVPEDVPGPHLKEFKGRQTHRQDSRVDTKSTSTRTRFLCLFLISYTDSRDDATTDHSMCDTRKNTLFSSELITPQRT